MGPLAALRVVELGAGPVSGLATMMLADFGAEVVRVEPPGGDPLAGLASAKLWRRGKTIVEADLKDPAAAAEVGAMVAGSADAVLTTLKPGLRESAGLGAGQLRAARPDLVYGSISGVAEAGPYADYPGYEALVAALSGRMMSFEGSASRRGPAYSALQVGVHATAQSAAAALLSGLRARAETGHGCEFSTSLLRGMLPYDLSGLQTEQLAARGIIDRSGGRQDVLKVMPRIYYHAARTRDGRWLQLGNLLPHLQRNFYRAAQIDVPEAGVPESGEALETFRNQLLARIAERDLDEWMEIFVRDGGVVAHPYQTTLEALDDPDLTANGHVVEVDGLRQLGLVAQLSATPGQVGRAPQIGSLARLAPREPAQAPAPPATPATRSPAPRRPLQGVTVVEAATIIAAPLGAATLADLGARVIKLEPLAGDPFRSMISGLGAAKCNTGKESICLDLKHPDGQRVAQALAARADVFIHNYRPGVPERLGIGYETLSAASPGLVYLSANGYGPAGPGAHRPSTHPIPGAALGGVVWQLGGLPGPGEMTLDEVREVTRKLFRGNEVNPDPNTSMVIATAASLGLLARSLTGKGQKILVDMFGANAYANWDDFLDFPGKPERPAVDQEQLGLGPGYRLYECADGWVFLFARSEQALRDLAGRSGPDADLAASLARRQVDDLCAELRGPDVFCVPASKGWPADFLLNHPLAAVEELVVPAAHPEWGEYLRHGPMVRFEQGGSYPGPSVAGDSTVSLLEELGYPAGQIEELLAADVVRRA